MSIDAIIYDVRTVDEGLELVLRPRGDNGPGQSRLTILHPTWEPPLDVAIWGGDSLVIIETVPQRHYRRVGYTRLVEKP